MALTRFTFTTLALIFVYSDATMDQAMKDAVLNMHNTVRREIATKSNSAWADRSPCTAADMEKMVWDATLASDSQTYAETCNGAHDTGAGSSFGENLYMSSGTSFDATALANGAKEWYDEIVDTQWLANEDKPKTKAYAQCQDPIGAGTASDPQRCNVGHYFQMIWAKSNKVGCGAKLCPGGVANAFTSPSWILVCRYLSAASLSGKGYPNSAPFLLGLPGAACAGNNDNGLCTAAPTRCLDRLSASNTVNVAVNGPNFEYTDCTTLIAAQSTWCTSLAALMGATDSCPLSCNECTVPPNVGSQYCGSGSGSSGGNGGTDSNNTNSNTNDATNTEDTNSTAPTPTPAPGVATTSGCVQWSTLTSFAVTLVISSFASS